jgi:acetyl-CoA C-acetyltransferase
MRRAAVVCPLRTPVGTFGGALRDVPVESLGSVVVKALLERTALDPARIDDVVFAQSYANSETPCVGRWIALQAGLPIDVPGLQIDRRCGGGLQAIVTAAMMVQTAACDIVLAGGVESMSRVEYYSTDVPIHVEQRKGDPILFARDEGIRADSTVDTLGRLRPVMKDGTVTAGNAAQQNDAAALNVNGSGISLGHPVGATGVRMMTTLTREMRRRGVRYGLETMCIGGGQGMAAILERA